MEASARYSDLLTMQAAGYGALSAGQAVTVEGMQHSTDVARVLPRYTTLATEENWISPTFIYHTWHVPDIML